MMRRLCLASVVVVGGEMLLPALDYAAKAAALGGCGVGVCSEDAVVLAAAPQAPRDTLEYSARRIHVMDTTDDALAAVVVVGLVADCRKLVRLAREACEQHRAVFKTALPAGRLAGILADALTRAARGAADRPFGAHVLVAGFDAFDEPALYRLTPDGRSVRLAGAGVGHGAKSTTAALAAALAVTPRPDDAAALDMARAAMGKAVEDLLDDEKTSDLLLLETLTLRRRRLRRPLLGDPLQADGKRASSSTHDDDADLSEED